MKNDLISDTIFNKNSENIDCGPNPVYLPGAYEQATTSCVSVIESLIDTTENSMDAESGNITLNLYGEIPKDKDGNLMFGLLDIIRIEIDDDGIGMSFPTLVVNLRGVFFPSSSHTDPEKRGKNGLGSKTNIHNFNIVEVITTTKNIVAPFDKSIEQYISDELKNQYLKKTKLKIGKPDTELRHLIMNKQGAVLVYPFETCEPDDSGTKIILREPKRGKIRIKLEQLIKRLGLSTEWLSNKKNNLIINFFDTNGKPINPLLNFKNSVTVESYEKKFRKIPDSDIICKLKGNSKKDSTMIYYDDENNYKTELFKADIDSDLGMIDYDIKVIRTKKLKTHEEEEHIKNEFIVSICGINVLNRESKTLLSVQYFLEKERLTSGHGFAYNICGIIKTKDIRLKNALMHNKTTLDEEDTYVQKFKANIVKILKRMHYRYVKITASDNENTIIDTTDDMKKELNTVMSRLQEIKNPKNTYKEIDIKWVKCHKNFIPAVYDPTSKSILLSKMHPAFITYQKNNFPKLMSMEKVYIAMASHISETENKPFNIVFGEILRQAFEIKSQKTKHKIIVRKIWSANKININAI